MDTVAYMEGCGKDFWPIGGVSGKPTSKQGHVWARRYAGDVRISDLDEIPEQEAKDAVRSGKM